MNDDQLEDLLKRLRPAGPPAQLRARIVAHGQPAHAWRWLAAAAALLVAIVGLQSASGGLRQSMRATEVSLAPEQAALADMQRTFDLTDLEVRALAMKQEFDRRLAINEPAPQDRQ